MQNSVSGQNTVVSSNRAPTELIFERSHCRSSHWARLGWHFDHRLSDLAESSARWLGFTYSGMLCKAPYEVAQSKMQLYVCVGFIELAIGS